MPSNCILQLFFTAVFNKCIYIDVIALDIFYLCMEIHVRPDEYLGLKRNIVGLSCIISLVLISYNIINYHAYLRYTWLTYYYLLQRLLQT